MQINETKFKAKIFSIGKTWWDLVSVRVVRIRVDRVVFIHWDWRDYKYVTCCTAIWHDAAGSNQHHTTQHHTAISRCVRCVLVATICTTMRRLSSRPDVIRPLAHCAMLWSAVLTTHCCNTALCCAVLYCVRLRCSYCFAAQTELSLYPPSIPHSRVLTSSSSAFWLRGVRCTTK